MQQSDTTALVILSGGQDSTTCLGWALNRYERVLTVGFEYGQRHHVEMECRATVREQACALSPLWASRLGEDAVISLDMFGQIGDTAMTSDMAIVMDDEGLPNTFVPGRNLIFVTTAAALAWRKGVRHLVLGVCETDFSGYPDCRDDTIKAMQVALNLGMNARFVVHTPLMWLNKAETWSMAHAEGGQPFVELVRTGTHTCYLGEHGELHPWGHGCGQCPACLLRARGWNTYQNKHRCPL